MQGKKAAHQARNPQGENHTKNKESTASAGEGFVC
jgi:hypothetical protein